MSGVLDAIGLISGGLGIIQFFLDNLPANDPAGASVQIKAGLGDDSSSNLVMTISTELLVHQPDSWVYRVAQLAVCTPLITTTTTLASAVLVLLETAVSVQSPLIR